MKDSIQQDKLAVWYKDVKKNEFTNPLLALSVLEKIIHDSVVPRDVKHLIEAMRMKGVCLSRTGKNQEGLEALNESLRLHYTHTPDDKTLLSPITYNIGIIHMIMGSYQLAINAFLNCLLIDKESKHARLYNNLGIVYADIGDKPKALEYYQKSLKLAEEHNKIGIIACVKSNIVETRFSMGQTQSLVEEALEILDFVEKHINEHKRFVRFKISTLCMLGEFYRVEKQFEKALKQQEKAWHLIKDSSNYRDSVVVFKNIANIYIDKNDEKNVIINIHKALDYAYKAELHTEKKEVLENVIQFYKNRNELAKAFPFQEKLYGLAEEQLKKSMGKNLQKILTDKELEIRLLEEKNKEIKEQNAILKQFAYIISHDLREPIRGITGFASMLNRKYAENLDETAKEYIQFILSEAHSMNRNLARLLQYTTIEKNEQLVKEVNLQKIINEIQQEYVNKSFEVNIKVEKASIKMQAEHARMLLTELIDNAVQFKKENEDCRVEIQNKLKDGYYHLSVKDYGVGIRAAYHDKVFRIFNKINKLKKGAGVGLSICERIVQLYKGGISIESTPNAYTIFDIKIPNPQ